MVPTAWEVKEFLLLVERLKLYEGISRSHVQQVTWSPEEETSAP
jgi:hypothetical protein